MTPSQSLQQKEAGRGKQGEMERQKEKEYAVHLESQLLFLDMWSSAWTQLVFPPNKKD